MPDSVAIHHAKLVSRVETGTIPSTARLSVPFGAASTPDVGWTLSSRGKALVLELGPIAIGRSDLNHALALFGELEEGVIRGLGEGARVARTLHLDTTNRPTDAELATTRALLRRALTLLRGPSAGPVLVEAMSTGYAVEFPDASDGHVFGQLVAAAAVLLSTATGEAAPVVAPSTIPPSAPAPSSDGALTIVPFVPGSRPLDEGFHAGAGCSEAGALLSAVKGAEEDQAWLLYGLPADGSHVGDDADVRMSAWFVPPRSVGGEPVPVPSLQDRPVLPHSVAAASVPTLEPASFHTPRPRRYIAEIYPRQQLLPREADRGSPDGYTWESLSVALRNRTPDGTDPFTFCHQFFQRVRVELSVRSGGEIRGKRSAEIEVFDVDRFGSLYSRLMNGLVAIDTRRQAADLNVPELHQGHHPWSPVLTIGTNKAMRYLAAVRQDLGLQQKHLPDPTWLIRVGLYLEFLTFLGIAEAVKAEYPDLLSSAERRVFETDPSFAELRTRINPAAWREVWRLRSIVPRRTRLLGFGPVDVANLLRKQAATLGFLKAHHDDLKHAIALAGPNLNDSQETWHRVFRDAERAVLSMSMSAFPELQYLPGKQREFALWHQKGDVKLVPEWLGGAVGDQDGVYPSAARQYRESMNEVAHWARDRKLMDYTGHECVPAAASLIEAHLSGRQKHLTALQARDGYGPSLAVAGGPVVRKTASSVEDIENHLARTPIFAPLLDAERRHLATCARRRVYGPLDRVVVQGQAGDSLFIIESGELEVFARQADGTDVQVALLNAGDVFGELALLTGKPRTATVRAADEASVVEITKADLAPVLEQRPALIEDLSRLLERRQAGLRDASNQHQRESNLPEEREDGAGSVSRLISAFFGRPGHAAA